MESAAYPVFFYGYLSGMGSKILVKDDQLLGGIIIFR